MICATAGEARFWLGRLGGLSGSAVFVDTVVFFVVVFVVIVVVLFAFSVFLVGSGRVAGVLHKGGVCGWEAAWGVLVGSITLVGR